MLCSTSTFVLWHTHVYLLPLPPPKPTCTHTQISVTEKLNNFRSSLKFTFFKPFLCENSRTTEHPVNTLLLQFPPTTDSFLYLLQRMLCMHVRAPSFPLQKLSLMSQSGSQRWIFDYLPLCCSRIAAMILAYTLQQLHTCRLEFIDQRVYIL